MYWLVSSKVQKIFLWSIWWPSFGPHLIQFQFWPRPLRKTFWKCSWKLADIDYNLCFWNWAKTVAKNISQSFSIIWNSDLLPDPMWSIYKPYLQIIKTNILINYQDVPYQKWSRQSTTVSTMFIYSLMWLPSFWQKVT